MKSTTFLLPLVLAGSAALSSAYGQVNSGVIAASPDHPRTWVVGASNIHQDLRWDRSKEMLVADVTYSTRDWADNMHPTKEDEYTLSFPSVRIDKSSGMLLAGQTPVGKVSDGLFGKEVVLNKNAELDIHRQHGRIFAAINPKMGY